MVTNLEQLKYPIGKFVCPAVITAEDLNNWIGSIAAFPLKLKNETKGLDQSELQQTYRPNGWNIAQVSTSLRGFTYE